MRYLMLSLFTVILILAGCGTSAESENTTNTGTNQEASQEENTEASKNEQANEQQSVYDRNVNDFELDIEFTDNRQWEFDYETGIEEPEAEIKKENGQDEEYEGSEAIEEIEALMQDLVITTDMTKEKIIEQVLNALNEQPENVKDFELEIDFADAETIEAEAGQSPV